MNIIPIINSKEGLCLSSANWDEIGITELCCNVKKLLFKPGIAFFNKNFNLHKFFGFYGKIYLDISDLKINKDGLIHLKSLFDGSKIRLNTHELLDSIVKMAPDFLVVNKDWGNTEELKKISIKNIILCDIDSINISNLPAHDGFIGNVYSSENFNIASNKFRFDFSLLDESCRCPTCTQQYTRAYLHHLFNKVPLLCQRYLIGHNIYYTVKNTHRY